MGVSLLESAFPCAPPVFLSPGLKGLGWIPSATWENRGWAGMPFPLTDMAKWVSLRSPKNLLNLNEIHTIEKVSARSRKDGRNE